MAESPADVGRRKQLGQERKLSCLRVKTDNSCVAESENGDGNQQHAAEKNEPEQQWCGLGAAIQFSDCSVDFGVRRSDLCRSLPQLRIVSSFEQASKLLHVRMIGQPAQKGRRKGRARIGSNVHSVSLSQN